MLRRMNFAPRVRLRRWLVAGWSLDEILIDLELDRLGGRTAFFTITET
jgi:hypothetical protein